MPTDPSSVQIALTPRFQKDLRSLAKRYRNIQSDLQPLIDQLKTGELPGDRFTGPQYSLFKVRLQNSDIKKGKRSGYRVVYYLKTQNHIILVTIYSKSDLADVDNETLAQAILQLEQQQLEQRNEELSYLFCNSVLARTWAFLSFLTSRLA
ncbi:MAG: type II toxin-antitoxin system RelE/ParE family toxin [Leptolyngbyaceae bacterium]|nr:type II toxin-antitoxin system RelE/ParE family toxin [Leptolyngbyaceae bacterium]